MRIILFIIDLNFFLILLVTHFYLKDKYDIETLIYIDSDITLVRHDDIVIPFGVDAQVQCYVSNINQCLVNKPSIYNSLDDKRHSAVLFDTLHLPSIPTFDNKLNNSLGFNEFINKYKSMGNNHFIVKHIYGQGSKDITSYSCSQLIDAYKNNSFDFDEYIIQPYLKINKLITVDCLCKKGKILEIVIEEKDSFFNKDCFNQCVDNPERKIISHNHPDFNIYSDYISKISKFTKYDGLIELELIKYGNKNTLLCLEINPRVSGVLLTIIDNRLIYIDKLLIGYLNQFLPKQIKNNNKKWFKLKPFVNGRNYLVTIKTYFFYIVYFVVTILVIIIIYICYNYLSQ